MPGPLLGATDPVFLALGFTDLGCGASYGLPSTFEFQEGPSSLKPLRNSGISTSGSSYGFYYS
jgi:hypothetical protein